MDGVEVKLNYNGRFGRFSDELNKDIQQIVETVSIPLHLSQNVATMDHTFHLTKTVEARDAIAQYCSKRSVLNNMGTGKGLTFVVYNNWGYHTGMELIANTTNKLYVFDKNYVNSRQRFFLFQIFRVWVGCARRFEAARYLHLQLNKNTKNELLSSKTLRIWQGCNKSTETFLMFNVLRLWKCYINVSEVERGYNTKNKNLYKKMASLTYEIKRKEVYVITDIIFDKTIEQTTFHLRNKDDDENELRYI